MSSGSRREIARTIEVEPGVLPYQPAFQVIRTTGGKGVTMTRDKLDNPEYRSDRARVALRLGNRKVSMSTPFGWIFGEHDLELASALFSAWTHKTGSASIAFQTLTVTVALNTLTRGSGSWITDGYRAGDKVAIVGLTTAANKKLWTIASLTASALTLTGLAAEATVSVSVRVVDPAAPFALAVTGLTTTVAGQITRGAGSWITDGIAVGDTVVLSGMAVVANNDPAGFPVTAVTATVLTITGFLADTATSGRVRQKQFLRDGVTPLTFYHEERQSDVAVGGFKTAGGQVVGKASLSAKINSLMTGSFDFVGMKFGRPTSTTVANSTVAASSRQPFDTFNGSIKEGGAVASVAGLDLSIDNGLEAKYELFNPDAIQIDPDDFMVTGSMTVYFKDKTLYDKFMDEVESQLYTRNVDLEGNAYEISLPRARYLAPDAGVTKKDVSHTYPIEALQDSVNKYHIQFTRTPV
jgi:hypothetical protein